jgi:hypothetical protein
MLEVKAVRPGFIVYFITGVRHVCDISENAFYLEL